MIKAKALGVGPTRVARFALAWVRLGETFIHSHRAIVVKRTALRWLRLLLSLAAASPGSSGSFGIVTQQIALIGFWQWLSLVSCLALSTPLVTQVQGVGDALAQVAEVAKASILECHPIRRTEEILS